MRKLNLYLWIIALMGVISSCSRAETAGPQNEASNRVRIGTSIDGALQTRAASVTIPADHKLRYVLEVWSTAGTPACIHRDEKTATGAEAVAFDFTLSEAGDYKALLWADFVPKTATESPVTSPNTYTHYADYYYTTNSDNGLRAVTLAKIGTDYVINDDARDAFFACIAIKKETGAFEESVELTRPFGQTNVIEKNTALLEKVATMTLKIDVPYLFDVEAGEPTGNAQIASTVTTLPTADGKRKANLFYDFIFAPATGQTTLGEIGLEFTSSDAHVTLPDYTIPANMPVVRNKRTNISGSILTANSNDAKLTVTVSDTWTTPDEEKELTSAPKVGDYFYQDGTISSTFSSDRTLVGKVFWIDPNNPMKGKILSSDQKTETGWTDAMSWTPSSTLPDGMSWRIPTKDELQYMYCAYNGAEPKTWIAITDAPIANVDARTAFNSNLSGSFGNYYYWSREEDSDNTDKAWCMTFNNGYTHTVNKNTEKGVRCVSEFEVK